MSTVRANNYYDASGGSNAQLYGVASPPNSMGFRNRIINGDMRIDQRNAGASITINSDSAKYSVDRWYFQGVNTDGVFTVQQSSTAPTGFTKSMLLTVTTADASVGSTQAYFFKQAIEGYNVADLGWGAAGAATVTLSFWVRSSLTGTFGGAIINGGANRSYPFTFVISSANTWEQKSVTIAGDTSGTWATDNTAGLQVYFSVGMGSTYLGTAGSWSGSTFLSATGATNLISTNGATFYITGVQLEAGTVASAFERRDYGRELIMCQRYYCKTFNQSVAPASNAGQAGAFLVPAPADTTADRGLLVTWRFPVSMRAAPTVTTFNPSAAGSGWFTSSGGSVAATTANAGTEAVMISHSAAATANQNAVIQATASAEL